MTLAEVEDYRLAKNKVAPFEMSLLSAVEEWIAGHGKIERFIFKKLLPKSFEAFLTSKPIEDHGARGEKDDEQRDPELRTVTIAIRCVIHDSLATVF